MFIRLAPSPMVRGAAWLRRHLAFRGRTMRAAAFMAVSLLAVLTILALVPSAAHAQAPQQDPSSQAGAAAPSASHEAGGEANLKLPDMANVSFLNGIDGHKLLMIGLLFCLLGGAFGLVIYLQLKN